MRQKKRKLQQKRTKSRAWLEAECLKIARRTLGGQRNPTRHNQATAPEGRGPELEGRRYHSAADGTGQRSSRAALAHLPDGDRRAPFY
jgi:hypothetical protein